MSLYERHRDTEHGLIKLRVCTIGLKAAVLPELKQMGPNNKKKKKVPRQILTSKGY